MHHSILPPRVVGLGCTALRPLLGFLLHDNFIIVFVRCSEGRGDIIIATRSGGVGSSTVQFRIFKVYTYTYFMYIVQLRIFQVYTSCTRTVQDILGI